MSDWYDKRAPRQFITGDDIRQAASRNEREVKISQNSTVTDEARELAMRLAIRLDDGTAKRSVSLASSAPRASGPSALSAAQPTLPDDTNKLIDPGSFGTAARRSASAGANGETRLPTRSSDDADAYRP
ncbi:MAG: hypothetical protein G4V63_09175, partial [Candidatus Afipia apatlaquensis]|nr:hypothetical protein [Candidatus Afipia apatlaquensis]